MRPNDLVKYNTLTRSLDNYAAVQAMPGITSAVAKDCFIRQIIDSIRRIEYIRLIKVKNSPISADPQSIAFDPLKAAAWHASQNNIDEAFWLIFLSIHFGRNKTTKWNLVRDVYSGLGNNIQWDWQSAGWWLRGPYAKGTKGAIAWRKGRLRYGPIAASTATS